jgi:hypothetical protein
MARRWRRRESRPMRSITSSGSQYVGRRLTPLVASGSVSNGLKTLVLCASHKGIEAEPGGAISECPTAGTY